MESKDLDGEMNSLLEKLAKRPVAVSAPYSADPLSSDHFILTRSWEFFKKRISAIEKQWQEIVNAKSEESRALKKELELKQARLYELEESNLSLETLLANFKITRLEDFEEFKKKNENLKMAWDEERISMESKLMTFELQIERERKKAEAEAKRSQEKLSAINKSVEELRKENQALQEKNLAAQQALQEIVLQKDESLGALLAKTDLLRREVERRDQIVQSLDEKSQKDEKTQRADQAEQNSLRAALQQKEEEIKNFRIQIGQILKEKANLLETWDREKSEWRELWDRARDVWEKRKS